MNLVSQELRRGQSVNVFMCQSKVFVFYFMAIKCSELQFDQHLSKLKKIK